MVLIMKVAYMSMKGMGVDVTTAGPALREGAACCAASSK
jgi:hypothetical protein